MRHFVERVYKRQDGQPDLLPDPYHRPRYGGWPEQLIQDNWARGGEDPDIAGIVPGPQANPWGDEEPPEEAEEEQRDS